MLPTPIGSRSACGRTVAYASATGRQRKRPSEERACGSARCKPSVVGV